MRSSVLRMLCIILLLGISAALCAGPTIVIRNNHDFDYAGPVTFKTKLREGVYRTIDCEALVKDGTARAGICVEAGQSVTLEYSGSEQSPPLFVIGPVPGGASLHDMGKEVGRVEFGLAVVPGKDCTAAQAVSSFKPLPMQFTTSSGRSLAGKCTVGDYTVEIRLFPFSKGWLACEAKITKTTDSQEPVYLALVRKVTMPRMIGIKTNWNGVLMDGTGDPAITDRISTLTKGVDWCSWKSGIMSYAAVNQFSAGYTTQDSKGKWIPANHFYTWEKAAEKDGSIYLVSEVAGPNPTQDKARYMGTTAYCPPLKGEPVILKWQLVTSRSPKPDWEKSQLYVAAGYRNVTETKDKATVDLGVPYVEFGTSYFPYSTMTENFDYYRTAGLDREGWWPFSPKMWENWKAFVPQMQTDLRIIKAMGFDLVRLHHLELLGAMDRANAFAFLDFYMGECRQLGLKVMFDTAGSPEWISSVVGRYKDLVKYVEIENEILIPGIPKGAPERWTAQYQAVKKVAPNTQTFLTGACNQGMFDRLSYLGVPFDRVGFHNYKHGPAFKESIPSVALGVANQASDMGKPAVLGEFNWKMLTTWDPIARAKEMGDIYAKMLEPRAIPTFCQFHWQETMSVNPRLTRQGIRHYETINLDRTRKPEADKLMMLIRKYKSFDSPVRALPIRMGPLPRVPTASAVVEFTINNNTGRDVHVKLTAECFGAECKLLSPADVTLKAGEMYTGSISPSVPADALPGAYHFFVRAQYFAGVASGGIAYGWGTMHKSGVPTFDPPVLADLVEYPQGADIVKKFNYGGNMIFVVFGKDCPTIEMEMAYQLRNTLQSATGRGIHLCSSADVPEAALKDCQFMLVGTPEKNPLIKEANPTLPTGKGAVILHNDRLILTGSTADQMQAAATDFVLRFWKNAKDSTSRISGLEKGAALGNKAAPGDVNLP